MNYGIVLLFVVMASLPLAMLFFREDNGGSQRSDDSHMHQNDTLDVLDDPSVNMNAFYDN